MADSSTENVEPTVDANRWHQRFLVLLACFILSVVGIIYYYQNRCSTYEFLVFQSAGQVRVTNNLNSCVHKNFRDFLSGKESAAEASAADEICAKQASQAMGRLEK